MYHDRTTLFRHDKVRIHTFLHFCQVKTEDFINNLFTEPFKNINKVVIVDVGGILWKG